MTSIFFEKHYSWMAAYRAMALVASPGKSPGRIGNARIEIATMLARCFGQTGRSAIGVLIGMVILLIVMLAAFCVYSVRAECKAHLKELEEALREEASR